jgi:o-succinylbenzoate---CoA ligase
MITAPVARLARWPASAPALAWPGGSMNYGQLRARVEHLARVAARLGGPGSPLAVISASRLDMALGVLAALRLGRPALPLEPVRPDLDGCIRACRPGGLLTDAEIAEAITGSGRDRGPMPDAGRSAQGRRDAPALLVPTSGTSGSARVAMLSAAALDAHVVASAAALPSLGPRDRWLVCLPMTSIGALAALWRTLSAGACFAFLERFDAADARRLMAAGASHVSVVPAMVAPLADAAAPAPCNLRCLLSGGGPLSGQAAEAALARDWPLWNGWGMTESASHVAVGQVDVDWREGVVGRPLPGAELAIDATSGRVAIGGPMLMSGYARPGMPPGMGLRPDGRLLSGDLGEFLPDGRLRVLGRADEVIVTGGMNVHPQPVEDVLAACPGVGEVAVTSRPDARWGRVLVALYTGAAAAGTLDAWAREKLPSASRPREFLHVHALPRNAMGKLLRGELPGLCQPGREDAPP